MNRIMTDRSRARQQRIVERLDKSNFPDDLSQPMFRAANIHFEMAERAVGTPYGGIGLIHQLAKTLGLPAAIDERLHLFKFHLPYHESDHVLNIAYNALCDGRCLQDLELRRQDEAYLNALGARAFPTRPRRATSAAAFTQEHLDALQEAIDVTRRKVWASQPASFFEQAILDGDGTMVETDGECKQGMDISYKGQWGYHPLVITLANTGEVLRLVNRSGNRPSHEGAAAKFDESIALCRAAGFRSIRASWRHRLLADEASGPLARAGTSPSASGWMSTAQRHILADDLPESAWKPLKRPAKYQVRDKTAEAAGASQATDRRTSAASRTFGWWTNGLRETHVSPCRLQTRPTACHPPEESEGPRTADSSSSSTTIATSSTSPTIGTARPKKSCSMPTIAANRKTFWRSSMPFGPCTRRSTICSATTPTC